MPVKPPAKTPAKSAPAKKPVTKAATKTAAKPAVKPVAKSAAKAAPKKAVAKPAVAANGPAVKVVAAAKPAATAKPVKPVAKPAPVAKDKLKKPKLVRDSFTMPAAEYQVLADLKKACIKAGFAVKKSELLRIGVVLLQKSNVAQLQSTLASLPSLKAGRPKKSK